MVGGSITGGSWVGGVVGRRQGSTVENCYATGAVSGTNYVGGVVGDSDGGGTVQNCYATGDVSGNDRVGGVVGYNDGSRSRMENCAALNPSVRSSYNQSNYIGRVAGYNNGTSSNNYARNPMIVQYNWNGTTGTNKTIDAGLNTLDGANMTTTDAVTASWWTETGRWNTANGGTAWDFINVWNPPNGNTLPTLRNMPSGTQNPVIQ
jgi:hypothetical protein